MTKPISSIEVQQQSSEQYREELENRTTVEASGQSESGETSDSSSSWEDSSERMR